METGGVSWTEQVGACQWWTASPLERCSLRSSSLPAVAFAELWQEAKAPAWAGAVRGNGV